MKKIGICIAISFLFFSCSSPSETPMIEEEITQENTPITQIASTYEKYVEVMKHIALAEERGSFDSNREYHKGECGEGIMYYDLGSSMDGPIYYIDTKNKKIVAERGGCGMSLTGCSGDISKEWMCNK